MADFRPRPPRRRVDLFKVLPPAARYALALAIIAAVALAGWWVGRDEPVPPAVGGFLVPLLGWLWLALAAVALASWLWRRRKARNPARSPEP